MSELLELGKNACDAKYVLQKLTTEEKNKALQTAANDLCERQEEILAANVLDLENGKNNGMNPGLLDRLKLTGERIAQIAEGLRQIAALPDCIGETMEHFERPNGLKIDKVRVPLGVIGIIYEARPNVTADAFGLCFKTGNAVILKGGSDAIHSNIAIVKVLQDALEACSMPRTAVQLIEDTDRAVTAQFMKMKEYVDVLIPRGGAGLIRSVVENSTIPVIETGTGNCHVYVDKAADLAKAVNIIVNAKASRPSVCNAEEVCLVHRDVAAQFLPLLKKAIVDDRAAAGLVPVELRLAPAAARIIDGTPAGERDFDTEFLDYILAVGVVDSVDAAIAHIAAHSTHHSDCIVTEDAAAAKKFTEQVDSAAVYVNVSTRFTDGGEFGLGCEMGISTQKLHARGPMGLDELCTYKYVVRGSGQIR